MADPGAPKDDYRVITDRIAELDRRIRELESPSGTQRNLVVQELAETVAAMQAVVDGLAAQVAFLQTQTQSAALTTITSFTGPGGGGSQWVAFNATFDVALTVTTAESGRIQVTPGALLTGGGGSALLGVEVVGVTAPSWPSPYVLASTDGTSTPSRTFEFALAPNTTYAIRNRRGFENSGIGLWGYQSLSVMRLR